MQGAILGYESVWYQTFERLHRKLSTNESFYVSVHDTGIGRCRRICEVKKRIINTVENNPWASWRREGNDLGLSHATVLQPYNLQGVQTLNSDDYLPCLKIARLYLQNIAANQAFNADVLFSDKASFTWLGLLNNHYSRLWVDDKPHGTRSKCTLTRKEFPLMFRKTLCTKTEPYVLPNHMTHTAHTPSSYKWSYLKFWSMFFQLFSD